jgi:hypothetical protein
MTAVLRAVRQFCREHPESHKRYLVNGLRETFDLIGVPIRLSMRAGGENPPRAEETAQFLTLRLFGQVVCATHDDNSPKRRARGRYSTSAAKRPHL